MKINWKVRAKNPVFWSQVIMAIALPVLVYGGLTVQDLTTWGAVWDMLRTAALNPYVLGLVLVSLWQTVNDPTTTGLSDSALAMSYTEPNKIKTTEE